ncbi:MAG: M20/M25/M40 family metallo-hydrolase [Armatimonadota bacterium]|nr:M20/M25/M40 family metallo-hydrolase [Armatimonadota bacterium]
MVHGDGAARFVDRDRLVAEFIKWAKVNAPSGKEREIAGLLEQQLRRMGFAVAFDMAHTKTGGDVGNLIARWSGTRAGLPAMFLSTHMDTVLPTEGLRPVIRDGVIFSDGTTILGADDRAALAAYLEAIRVIQERGTACGPVELILTVSEQPGLVGARYLDYSLVTARAGYVFDSSGDVGQIVVKGPYSSRLRWRILGRPAHLGLAPDDGVNAIVIAAEAITAMRLGRVDATTVANVGLIHGGRLPSIIPDIVEMVGEARSVTASGLQAQIDAMTGAVADAARRRAGAVELVIEKKYLGFDYARDHEHVRLAVRAATRIGVTPYFTETLGGADTNIFNEHGLTCITLGNGLRSIHSFEEHISIENLVNTARYAAALIEEFAATPHDPNDPKEAP